MILRKLLGVKGYKTLKDGLGGEHPIFSAGLGICSALAVTNTVANCIAMGIGVTFVLLATSLMSLLSSSLMSPGELTAKARPAKAFMMAGFRAIVSMELGTNPICASTRSNRSAWSARSARLRGVSRVISRFLLS